MKYLFQAILLLLSAQAFSQYKSFAKVINLTSKADTVYFTADNSGCFNAYILEVKMCKQKSGARKLIFRSKTGNDEKTISGKDYNAFIKNFQNSVDHFIKVGKGKCTNTVAFELMCKNKNGTVNSTTFKNSTCEAEYNPEMFLQELIRKNEGEKK